MSLYNCLHYISNELLEVLHIWHRIKTMDFGDNIHRLKVRRLNFNPNISGTR